MSNILRWGVFFIVLCLPLYLVRFSIFNIPTTVLELMIYALFLAWLVSKGYKNLWTALKDEKLLAWGIVLLIIGISAAAAFSWDLRVSAGIWKAWFIDPILFFIVLISVIRKKDIKTILNVLILSGFVVAIISLFYFFQGTLKQGRLQGIYDSPNFLAMYLALPLILSLCFSLRLSPRLPLYLVSFLLFSVTLLFTKSFGALLGILGALLFGLLAYFYIKNKKAIVLMIVFLFFGAVFVVGLLKINSAIGLKSFDARFVIWQKALDVFADSPILGIGPGTFESYFPLFPKWGVPQPHNIFLAFLIQTGMAGFVGFIIILIWFFRRGLKLLKTQYSLLLMIITAYILIHGLVDTTYWKNDLSVIFWLIMGLMLIIKKESS